MSRSTPPLDGSSTLETVVERARECEPTTLSDARQEALVRTAMAVARAQRQEEAAHPRLRDRLPWKTLRVALVTAALTAAVFGLLSRRAVPPPRARSAEAVPAERPDSAGPPEAPVLGREAGPETTLPSGDRVTATTDARWTLASAARAERRVVVEQGVVLFDVRPLAEGESFEVHAGSVRVAVRGTVFSVEELEGEVRVRVYEGVVQVSDGDRVQRVEASEMWASAEARVAALAPGRLHDAGERAAAQRSQEVGDQESGSQESGSQESGSQEPDRSDELSDALALETEADESGPSEETAHLPALAPEPTSAAAPTRERRPPPITLESARAWLRQGDAQRALDAARDPRRANASSPTWELTRADALRALGRTREAADAYDRVARLGVQRHESGYTAARLRFSALADPAGALRSLDAAGVQEGALAERALGLRARALTRLGRHAEAEAVARHYLVRYPAGGLAAWMRERVATAEVAPRESSGVGAE